LPFLLNYPFPLIGDSEPLTAAYCFLHTGH
jgi:hypothetical protein